jgi:hypothetical protein
MLSKIAKSDGEIISDKAPYIDSIIRPKINIQPAHYKKPCEIDYETLQIGHCERVQRCTDRHIGCDIEVALAERNKEIK